MDVVNWNLYSLDIVPVFMSRAEGSEWNRKCKGLFVLHTSCILLILFNRSPDVNLIYNNFISVENTSNSLFFPKSVNKRILL